MKTAGWRYIPCPSCGAPAGERCRKKTFAGNIPAENPHAARRIACRPLTPARVANVCAAVKRSADRFSKAESLRMRGAALIQRALG